LSSIPFFRHIRKIRAANTQIQDDLLAAPQICFDNRPYLSRVFLDPGSGSIASGAWPKPTSVSQSIVRKVRVYGCEIFAKVPGRPLAYAKVFFVRFVFRFTRCVDYTRPLTTVLPAVW